MSARLIKKTEARAAAFTLYAIPAAELPRSILSPKTGWEHELAPAEETKAETLNAPRQVSPSVMLEKNEAPETMTTLATLEAQLMLEEAQTKALDIIADANARADTIEREARERGLLEARANIQTDLARAVEPWREKLVTTLEELNGLRHPIATHTERDMVRLALEIAKKVVQREVTVDPEVVLTLARVALARLHTRAVVTIHLHPDDYAYVIARRTQLEGSGAVEIVEDRSIGRGGCLIQTEMGDVDARIEQQLAEIERGLL